MSLGGVSPVEAVAIAFVGRILQTASWLPWWFSHTFEGKQFKEPRPA
jgi:hypothetical protein